MTRRTTARRSLFRVEEQGSISSHRQPARPPLGQRQSLLVDVPDVEETLGSISSHVAPGGSRTQTSKCLDRNIPGLALVKLIREGQGRVVEVIRENGHLPEFVAAGLFSGLGQSALAYTRVRHMSTCGACPSYVPSSTPRRVHYAYTHFCGLSALYHRPRCARHLPSSSEACRP